MSSNFFAMVERMKLIDRWALMNNTGKENIAEHSHTCLLYTSPSPRDCS